MSGNIFGFAAWGWVSTGVWRVEGKGAANHPTVHRTAPHDNELSGLKCP